LVDGCPELQRDPYVAFVRRFLAALAVLSSSSVVAFTNVDGSSSPMDATVLGRVVPLHCGHSGFPHAVALSCLVRAMVDAGIPLEADDDDGYGQGIDL
jgi:hypothetical protein